MVTRITVTPTTQQREDASALQVNPDSIFSFNFVPISITCYSVQVHKGPHCMSRVSQAASVCRDDFLPGIK